MPEHPVPEEPVLIEPGELATLLDGDRPPVLADVRWVLGGPPQQAAYEEAHLPGAHWVDLEAVLTSPPGSGGRHPLPPAQVFEAAMRRIGLDGNALLVAYDAANSQAASRLWWLLTDAGHRRVRVLNGGLAAWQRAGLPTVSGPSPAVRPGDFVVRPGQRPQFNGAQLHGGLESATAPLLVDVRAAERYSGESESIDPVAGHIPGAINLPSMANVDETGRFLDRAQLRERYSAAGAAHGAVLYCGSGITAAHSLLAMESAGLTAAIYPGSWSEWITDPDRPVAVGQNRDATPGP
jgi:thiosulfate/3-mercaptopyruvate sulfurtransferase